MTTEATTNSAMLPAMTSKTSLSTGMLGVETPPGVVDIAVIVESEGKTRVKKLDPSK